jgi:uncharacterized membrane protein YjjB (DUF3815 family)
MASSSTSVAGIVLLVLGILALIGGLVDLVETYLIYTAFQGFIGPGIWMVPAVALTFGIILTTLGAYLIHRKSSSVARRRPNGRRH